MVTKQMLTEDGEKEEKIEISKLTESFFCEMLLNCNFVLSNGRFRM
jgi:hypothetical protein